jgi:hypothetical protein
MRLRTVTQRESKRQSQGEPGQGKAKQRRSKNQLEKDKIRGGASETARESSPPPHSDEILFATLLPGTTKQNSARDQPRLGLLRSIQEAPLDGVLRKAKEQNVLTARHAGSCFCVLAIEACGLAGRLAPLL